ncbi:MAG: SMP-30/gluconolactonase/LRE family protein [Scytonema sp. PMC 1069.18]|nr:SMP-30/gluconolactonase/LRE family protein [Scytonema sp. PMC 1069.18]MEC4883585.1 SMP-30/gluconolactonase/LRE family protein [Scytonema sp. PMC 1070.18]
MSAIFGYSLTKAKNSSKLKFSKSSFQSNETSVKLSKTGDTKSLQAIVAPDTKLEKVAGGFQFTEGPVWHPQGFLLFSDIPANSIYKWVPNKKPEIFRRPSGNTNGNTLDRQGRLISGEHSNRRVSRTEKNGRIVTLASQYGRKRLNSPNDLVVKSDGSIYFTDPPYGIKKEQEELGFYGVYRLTKPEPWQIEGIIAALDDNHLKVKEYAFNKLGEYEIKDLQSKKRQEIIQKAADILKDEKVDAYVRGSAASALGNFRASAAKYLPDILNFLKDEKVPANVRGSAASALGNIKQLKMQEVVVILNYVYEPYQRNFSSDGIFEYWRFLTYFLGGGTDEVKTLLTWLGYPHLQTLPTQLKYEDGKKTLNLLLNVWDSSQDLKRLQDDLAQKISETMVLPP